MKGFWKFFIFSIIVAAISLVGATIGKNFVGYIIFGLSLAGTIALFAVAFFKKAFFKEERWKYLVIGLVVSALLASSIALFISSGSKTSASTARASTSSVSSMSSLLGGSSQRGSQFGGNFSGGGGTGRTFSGTGRTYSGTGTTTTSGTTSGTTRFTSAAVLAREKAEKTYAWILLGVGLAALLAVVVLTVLKKLSFKGDHRKVLLLGLVIGALLAVSTTTLLSKQSFSRPGAFPGGSSAMNGQTIPGGTQPGAAAGTVAATAVTATVTPTPLAATATATPQATATATTVVTSSLVVCLSPDHIVGLDIREFPSDTAHSVGTIPIAGCFTIDGKSSQYPGWYHLATGQNGFGGIYIGVDETTHQLWVSGKNIVKPLTDMDTLPELTVTGKVQ